LRREELDALLDTIAANVRRDERVAWLGLSSEVSPCALHVGLLQRGGSRERFERNAARPLDVTYFPVDPKWTDDELARFASGFDVILFTDPVDLKARKDREFMSGYCRRLTARLGYRKQLLAEVPIAVPMSAPRMVELYACRKP